jgi:hypothetical protein
MKFIKLLGQGMMFGARAHAQWEIDVSNRVFGSRKRLLVLMLLMVPAVAGGIALADDLPDMLGGKSSYSPAFYSTTIFLASIGIGLMAGLITGCIGAGGGFIIAPALMSAGIKGILAVGTDLFHIFAKAIMGSVIHRKLGNVSVPLAVVFLIGAVIGATLGGVINRGLYELNPVISDAFITTIYSGSTPCSTSSKRAGHPRRPTPPRAPPPTTAGRSKAPRWAGCPGSCRRSTSRPWSASTSTSSRAAAASPGCSWWRAARWSGWPRASWGSGAGSSPSRSSSTCSASPP